LGHQELRPGYDKLRKSLVKAGGLKIAQEIEKIALHKAGLIARNKEIMRKHSKPTESMILEINNIQEEDVLFDAQFWQNIFTGTLNTGNLNEWLKSSEIYSLQLNRNAERAQHNIDRLSSYTDSDAK
jgi:hypothetical protein